jgi:GT2 family glycosyltransferase
MHANEYLKSFIGYDTRIAEFIKKIFKTKSLDSYWDHNSIREVDHVTGACMMIKREAIDKVGLLDEAFFLYNEEVEWSYRFKQAGYKSIFVSDSSIIHLFGYSTKQCVQKQTANNLLVERYRGMFYFFQKHYGKIKLFLLKTIVAEAFTLRIIFSYIYSVFTTDEKSRIKKNERVYLKQILALSTAKNFDWRNRQ